MDFLPQENQVIEKIEKDPTYIKYLCRLWYREGSLESLSNRLEVREDFFYKIFALNPDIEDAFDDGLREVSNKAAKRINSLSLPVGLEKLKEIIDYGEDDRLKIQAVGLQLQYFLKSEGKKKGNRVEEDELDRLFEEIGKEGKGEKT